ncbi:anillin [Chironomus tepperi]|uniref:anillin n=1 Tax=Chironomus tepperi TaxID=113505 RepID=UPI00391F3C8F
MDNFTKGLLERNEKRNKALGITSNQSSLLEENSFVDKENKRLDTVKVSSPRKSSQTSQVTRYSSNNTPKTVSSKKEDADVAVEINITSTQNIQVEVEVAECEYDEDGKMIKKGESTLNSLSNFDNINNAVQLRDHSRKNLKRLGVLYSDNDQISSPIQRTEEKFCESTLNTRPIKKYSKLAELAQDINSWDDDYSHHQTKSGKSPMKGNSVSSKSSSSSPAKTNSTISTDKPRSAITSSPSRKDSLLKSGTDKSSSSPKKLLWDKKVMDSLEAQGFARRESTTPKLVYDYSKSEPSTSSASPKKSSFIKPADIAPTKSPAKKHSINSPSKKEAPKAPPQPVSMPAPKPVQSSSSQSSNKSIDQRSVRFTNNFAKNPKDPAEMSLKERMAIFEKNKGKAPVPRSQFGITDANPIRSNMPELSKKYDFGFKSPGKSVTCGNLSSDSVNKDSVIEKATINIKSAVNKLLSEKEQTISEQQISNEIRKQKEEDMKCIMNRYNKQEQEMVKESDGDEIMFEEKSERKRRSSGSDKFIIEQVPKQTSADDKKRARVSNTQRLYPVLSDIESTTDSEVDNYTTATVSCTEDNSEPNHYAESSPRATSNEPDMSSDSESEDLNLSIGRELLNKVRKSTDLGSQSYLESTVDSTDVSDAMHDMDDYLNEALDDSKDYDDKGSACSDSFEYERYPKRVSFKEFSKDNDIPVRSKVEISPRKNANDSITLVHTVSFYRRQQTASASNTPIKKVVHKVEDNDKNETLRTQITRKAKEECENKIQRLLDEVMRQQTIISQTSQALNLCASTVEFSGSTEAVEGERHLLVATHRRLACLNEVQRLKVEGHVDRFGAAKEKGTLTISEIIIPLKQTYINRLATDEINGHHLLCLVKYNEYVLATKTLPTLPGLKSVKFTDNLTFNEVYADFKITLEIYGMTAQREILPHDIKYHIQTPNKKKFKTRLQESNLVRPPIQSPGGPNAVRTPALVQYGYIIFSLREIKQKSWVINETAAGVSPLNGNVYLKIDSKITVDVNHCGFLTMFDDISGFGAWHRRWCRLSGNTLYYWKYPEDEKRKEALGQVDLTSISTERADQAPRTICSRLHTILLESKRERRSDDVETLVCVPKENYTLARYLLAADTKEEREEWCEHLNKSLSLLKSWNNSKH